ncbi:MAG: hypothetical protein RBR06_11735 [Desulfuromonadaceae bacterium]|nr:hypothetical protein [Desulfuromonadaceae bacterium]
MIDYLLAKAQEDERLTQKEIQHLLSYDPYSSAACRTIGVASELSRLLQDNEAEIHGLLALNQAACSDGGKSCTNDADASVLSIEEAVAKAKRLEEEGCHVIQIATTSDFSYLKLAPYLSKLRAALKPHIPLVINGGKDLAEHAKEIKQAGVSGVYHALHLRSEEDADNSAEQRCASIDKFLAAGLQVATGVESIGPEHNNREIAELICYAASIKSVFSGAARRIPVPDTPMGVMGTIPEVRQAQIVAITRLAMPHATIATCTNAPCALAALGGASFFWAEMCTNPRASVTGTEERRKLSVEELLHIFWESGWNARQGKSRIWGV